MEDDTITAVLIGPPPTTTPYGLSKLAQKLRWHYREVLVGSREMVSWKTRSGEWPIQKSIAVHMDGMWFDGGPVLGIYVEVLDNIFAQLTG